MRRKWLCVALAVTIFAGWFGLRTRASSGSDAAVRELSAETGIYTEVAGIAWLPNGFLGIETPGNIKLRVINDEIVYCMELGVGINGQGSEHPLNSSQWFDDLDAGQRRLLSYALYYGYGMSDAPTDTAVWYRDRYVEIGRYAATQVVVWEIIEGYTSDDERAEAKQMMLETAVWYNTVNTDYIKVSKSEFGTFYDNLWNCLDEAMRIPSFSAAEKEQGPVHMLRYDHTAGNYTATLTDTNEMLDSIYTTLTHNCPGLTYSKSGNTITITCNSAMDTPQLISMIPASGSAQTAQKGAKLYRWIWNDHDWQQMIGGEGSVSEPLYGYFYLQTEAPGNIEVYKIGAVSGKPIGSAEYTVYADGACTEPVAVMVTDENGYGKTVDLRPGIYYVKETKAPTGYGLNESIEEIEVISGQTTALGISRYEPEWLARLTVTKTDCVTGELLSGADLTVYEWSENAEAYVFLEEMKEQSPGQYTANELGYTDDNQGKFKVEETKNPDGYTGNFVQEFSMDQDQPPGSVQTFTFAFEAENTPIRYRFIKMDEEGGRVADCQFELYDSAGRLIDSWITDLTGVHESVAQLREGETYLLKEVDCPIGYEKAEDTIFTVGAQEDWVEIEMINQEIRGSITVYKCDAAKTLRDGAEYALLTTQVIPDAEFYQYKDTAYFLLGQKKTENGFVVFDDLDTVHGYQYLIVETKAPEGTTLLAEPIEVGQIPRIVEGWDLDDDAGRTQEKDGIVYLYDLSYTVVNTETFILPHTGSVNLNGLLIPMMTAAAALTGCMAHHRSKVGRKKEEMEW